MSMFFRAARTAASVVTEVETLLSRGRAALPTAPLPDEPDRERVERWLMEVQTQWIHGDTSGLMLVEPS